MASEIEKLKADISLLAIEIANSTDDFHHRSHLLMLLSEKSKRLEELQAIPSDSYNLNIATEQTIRSIATQGGDYSEGTLDKRVFNFFTIYTRSSEHLFRDPRWQQWQPQDWDQAARRYRNELIRLYGSMQILGMSRPIPLDNIFTDAYLLDKPGALRRFSIEELQQQYKHVGDNLYAEPRRLGIDLVHEELRLFIFGKPGAGKTTFLKHIILQSIQGKLDTIPIFIPLKSWADSHLDLMPFIVNQFTICGFPEAQPFIQAIMNAGKGIFLFDGLDEVNVSEGERQRITNVVRNFANQYNQCHIVITCRTAAADYLFEQFSYCELADFTYTQAQIFVSRWFQHVPEKRELFLKAFEQPEHQNLQDLARTPLLLTLLCLTFEETLAFPERRVELYEEALDALLKKWDSSRSIQRDVFYKQLSLGHKRQMLMELAAETFDRGEVFVRREQLASRIEKFLSRLPGYVQNEIDGADVIRAIEAQHGLLVERAQGIYSFSHLTFQEYFTARYIASGAHKEQLINLVKQASSPRWREVLLLTASLLDLGNSMRLFQLWFLYNKQLINDTEIESFLDWLSSMGGQKNLESSYESRVTALALILLDRIFSYSDNINVLNDGNRVIMSGESMVGKIYRLIDRLILCLGVKIEDITKLSEKRNIISINFIEPLLLLGKVDFDERFDEFSSNVKDNIVKDINFGCIISFSQIYINNKTINNSVVFWYSIIWSFELIKNLENNGIRFISKDILVSIITSLKNIYDNQVDMDIAESIMNYLRNNKLSWNEVSSFVRETIQKYNMVGRNWSLSDLQLAKIEKLINSTQMMVDCLSVAYVDDRSKILNTVLRIR